MCIVRQFVTQHIVLYRQFYPADVNSAWKLITRLVLDVTFGPFRFHIVIFPLSKNVLAGWAAYSKDDPMTSKSAKVFRIYRDYDHPKEENPFFLYEDTEYNYSCPYYGTLIDRQIEALTDKKGGEIGGGNATKNPNEANLLDEITALKKEVTKLQECIKTLTTDETKLQESIQTLTTDETKLQESIKTLTTDETKLQESIKTLTTDETKLQESIKTLTTDETKLQESIKTLTTDETKLQKSIKTLTTDETKLQKSIKTLTTDETKLQPSIDKLIKILTKNETEL
jgi:DNA repair exonuclease SbcCD ATPase subunit